MYRGFNLQLSDTNKYLKYSYNAIDNDKAEIKSVIDSFLLKDGSIDGTKMQDNWFPQIKADIFLSHSHKDEKLVKGFAGCLYDTFGLKTFIDSCVWGYSNDLLKKIDDEYCKSGEHTYSYAKRNYSTSHVHLMLSCALAKMMDNCECVMFLNTPNSVRPEEVISQTVSPWIYQELAFTQLIRKRDINAYRQQRLVESFSHGGKIPVKYNIDLSQLYKIDDDILSKWCDSFSESHTRKGSHTLDLLYFMTNKNAR